MTRRLVKHAEINKQIQSQMNKLNICSLLNGQFTSFANVDRKDILQQYIITLEEASNSPCLNILGDQYICSCQY